MMNTDSEMSRASAAARKRPAGLGRIPGLLPAAATAALSGVLCWLWLSAPTASRAGQDAAVAQLAPVDEQDMTAALATMNWSPAVQAEYKMGAKECRNPLAWVALAAEAGQPSVKVRLRSGHYLSPVFDLSNVPVRIAIPYPGPYQTGRGTLEAMHTGGGAIIALLPAWHVPWPDGATVHEVTWRPNQRCAQPDG
jgi:hypothetical protein